MQQPIILFGGASFEHEISIVSAIGLHQAIGVRCEFVFLSSDHRFYLIDLINMRADYFASGKFSRSTELFLANGGFERKTLFGRTPIDCDVIISVVHGADGEDGTLAALFDFYNIAYLGPRIEASTLSYNKHLTKHLAIMAGVRTLPYEIVRRGEVVKTPYPYIMKPLRLGSSLGISVVKGASDLDYAHDSAFEFDSEAIVEPYIASVREYNLAGCYADDWHLSVIEEPQKKEFLDFDQKYLDFTRTSKAKEADLDGNVAAAMREAFKRIYGVGFFGALIRCDFFVIDNEVYLNEINPVPGSLANYLFDNYESALIALIENLPRRKSITASYNYIHSIRSQKGKL
ncbi:D-alanine--D-alanine ligase [Campylobacterota bacterium]|nr:D-alanine--D-alanine ligase [Campylobacterota bacterium]